MPDDIKTQGGAITDAPTELSDDEHLGEQLVRALVGDRFPADEKTKTTEAAGAESPVEDEKVPEDKPSETQEPPQDEQTQITAKVQAEWNALSDEDRIKKAKEMGYIPVYRDGKPAGFVRLEKDVVKGIVDGQEREYTLKDLLEKAQIGDAIRVRMNEAAIARRKAEELKKAMEEEYQRREAAYTEFMSLTTANVPDERFAGDILARDIVHGASAVDDVKMAIDLYRLRSFIAELVAAKEARIRSELDTEANAGISFFTGLSSAIQTAYEKHGLEELADTFTGSAALKGAITNRAIELMETEGVIVKDKPPEVSEEVFILYADKAAEEIKSCFDKAVSARVQEYHEAAVSRLRADPDFRAEVLREAKEKGETIPEVPAHAGKPGEEKKEPEPGSELGGGFNPS